MNDFYADTSYKAGQLDISNFVDECLEVIKWTKDPANSRETGFHNVGNCSNIFGVLNTTKLREKYHPRFDARITRFEMPHACHAGNSTSHLFNDPRDLGLDSYFAESHTFFYAEIDANGIDKAERYRQSTLRGAHARKKPKKVAKK